MSLFGGILLIGLFIGLYRLMHRGHDAHGGNTVPEAAPPRHQNAAERGTAPTSARARKHPHSGC
jgi:hypothetical protein